MSTNYPEPHVSAWIKAARSSSSSSCVEMRRHGVHVELRDSKNPLGPVMRFSGAAFAAWLGAAKRSEFDHLS